MRLSIIEKIIIACIFCILLFILVPYIKGNKIPSSKTIDITVCTYGHLYGIFDNHSNQQSIVPLFGDDDKPIKCKKD